MNELSTKKKKKNSDQNETPKNFQVLFHLNFIIHELSLPSLIQSTKI